MTPEIDMTQTAREDVSHYWCSVVGTTETYRVLLLNITSNGLWQSADTSLQRAHKTRQYPSFILACQIY